MVSIPLTHLVTGNKMVINKIAPLLQLVGGLSLKEAGSERENCRGEAGFGLNVL